MFYGVMTLWLGQTSTYKNSKYFFFFFREGEGSLFTRASDSKQENDV